MNIYKAAGLQHLPFLYEAAYFHEAQLLHQVYAFTIYRTKPNPVVTLRIRAFWLPSKLSCCLPI
jgi:hypothetical protein